ncbi:MAG: alkaline phosphatase family protein [Thermoplasmata archaeon]|nr:alkaline phosphatase family protein [Thermoplasmata archaeon]MCI4358832.1 alkaline phosphatase family protein [Thermoplasmata archaeon]
MVTRSRVLVLGLDSLSPSILTSRFRSHLPRITRQVERGALGTLKSCDPPITIPAWAVMFTGMDAGSLGLYGFRNRRSGTYFENVTPTPAGLPYPAVWDVASRVGRRVCVVGVPPGYPPPAVNGVYVSCLLTPPGARDFVSPVSLVDEVEQVTGGYQFDVLFRTEERAAVARELMEMTRKRWTLARHLWKKEPWDLFIVHEIGTDRLHHAFWKYFDPAHPRHDPNPQFANVGDLYYDLLDQEVGALLDLVGDDVTVLIVSDHGTQAMEGCFCINEWLRSKGWLTLKEPCPAGTPLERANVDWSRTKAWGAGGYYARIHLNLRGREPEGIVDPSEAPEVLDRLAAELEDVRGPNGHLLGVELARPSEIYDEVRGLPPDLIVYFADLKWRSAGTLGHSSLFLDENDTGPDDAVHSWDGILAAAGPNLKAKGAISTSRIRDVGPTILRLMGIPPPLTMRGQVISGLLGRHHHEER